MILLAIDPGGTPTAANSTSAMGWSTWFYDALTPLRPIAHGQVQGNEDVFIQWWRAEAQHFGMDEIVCEMFIPDGRTMFPDITPKAVEGALKALTDLPIYFQENRMKSHLRDERIKDLGLWWEGQGHATDSMRHAFAYMKLTRHMPTMRMVWPPRAR